MIVVPAERPLDPPGRDLAWKNRRTIAERLHWPEGALEACEQIEQDHPEWYPNWSAGGWPIYQEPGFYALRWNNRERMERPVYGADPEQLAAALKDQPPSRWDPYA